MTSADPGTTTDDRRPSDYELRRLAEGIPATMLGRLAAEVVSLRGRLTAATEKLNDTVRLADIAEESRADLARQNQVAEGRIARAYTYAGLLIASSQQRPEVVAVDAAWAIRNALGNLGMAEPGAVAGPFALYVDGSCWGDGYETLDLALGDALEAISDRDSIDGVEVRAVAALGVQQ